MSCHVFRVHGTAERSIVMLLTLTFFLFAATAGASAENITRGESANSSTGTDSPVCTYGDITNDSPPVVSGNVVLGGTLSSTAGTWTSCTIPIISTAYQWLRDGLPVGSNSNTYTVGGGDVGHT